MPLPCSNMWLGVVSNASWRWRSALSFELNVDISSYISCLRRFNTSLIFFYSVTNNSLSNARRTTMQMACTVATRCFVLSLQDACTVTTRCLYYHYKVLVLPLQGALYYRYKKLVLRLQGTCSITKHGIALIRC